MHLHRTLTPNGVARTLLAVIALLLVAGLLAVYLKSVAGFNSALGFVPLFHLDLEYNIPSLYSAVGILTNGLILFYIARIATSVGNTDAKYWKAMGWVFVYLSVDELASIHEHLDSIVMHFFGESVKHSGSPFWVLPIMVLLVLLGLYFIRFYLRLPLETKIHFCIAGVVYISGAVGVEILGNPQDEQSLSGLARALYSTLEETMEMVGMVLFLRAQLSYIVNHTHTDDHGVTFHFKNTNPPLATPLLPQQSDPQMDLKPGRN